MGVGVDLQRDQDQSTRGRDVLRSKIPSMIYREFYGLLLNHYAVRELMLHASQDDHGEEELERLSFIRSLRLVRRHITGQAAFSP